MSTLADGALATAEAELEHLRTDLLLRLGHLPSCGEGAEFPWDCTCDWKGAYERLKAALALPADGVIVTPDSLARALAIVYMTDSAFIQGPSTHTKEQAAEHAGEWMLDSAAILAVLAAEGGPA